MKKAPTIRAKRTEPVMTVHVQVACRKRGIPDARRIRRWARAALAGRRKRTEVTIRVVGAREGRVLNERWRGLPQATNVLSFPALALAQAPGALGDIAVCAPVVAREARAQGKSPTAHWAHLVIHGVLHLLGHDHESRRDAAAMETLEIRILAGLGFPDPYSVERT
ncbi:MAG: rRNA maturation RNase YbeY [Gammaproteobacteria bacterium RIFCSPLOWO2_02_FULL_61_13]|nr:MAG: rRNA maturation RNase YbeY [Gammaproteobacteria bacterium RIFCSPLOWO2_02_FULL_61_13]